MATLWTAQELEKATGGYFTTQPACEISGVSIDSRSLEPGDVFLAIIGPNHDGHEFIGQARSNGASCAIVSDASVIEDQFPCLVVPNTERALEAMGIWARERATKTTRIAITGSVGKTSIKDALSYALGSVGLCHSSSKSHNNHWGVPLTMARMASTCDYGVFEIGMNSPGEIAPLSRMVKPHICIISTIAPAHLAGFASFERLAEEKASIFEGIESGGIAIIHRDHPHYSLAFEVARRCNAIRVISFGQHRSSTIRLADYRPRGSVKPRGEDLSPSAKKVRMASGESYSRLSKPPAFQRSSEIDSLAVTTTSVATDYGGSSLGLLPTKEDEDFASEVCYDVYGSRIPFRIKTVGRHNAINFAAVLGCGFALNLDMNSFISALERVKATSRRSEVINLQIGRGYITIIDDSHNANPASMNAAIALLAERSHGRRTVAILSDMLELGSEADSWHAAVADQLKHHAIDRVFLAGNHMLAAWERLPSTMHGAHKQTSAELIPAVLSDLSVGDILLVKGSRAGRAEVVSQAIVEHCRTLLATTADKDK